jgi:hypothetical protein
VKVYEIVEKAPQFEAYFFPGGAENVSDATRFIWEKTSQQVSWQPEIDFGKHGQGEMIIIHGRRNGTTVERNIYIRPRQWIMFEGPSKIRVLHEGEFQERYNVVMEKERTDDAGDAQPE